MLLNTSMRMALKQEKEGVGANRHFTICCVMKNIKALLHSARGVNIIITRIEMIR
jgi:hypothetical protein